MGEIRQKIPLILYQVQKISVKMISLRLFVLLFVGLCAISTTRAGWAPCTDEPEGKCGTISPAMGKFWTSYCEGCAHGAELCCKSCQKAGAKVDKCIKKYGY